MQNPEETSGQGYSVFWLKMNYTNLKLHLLVYIIITFRTKLFAVNKYRLLRVNYLDKGKISNSFFIKIHTHITTNGLCVT